ncbi:sulfurtransferase TusA family protein [Phreatobacter stygius]|uniref:Sulfurtransferase TusA family protein n=1 Tax=Phreatobacter stygius TaxID=1940610 RepID=A0A4D7B4N7_9HYPH|nr:sulfurtransferase TusA family protein [Phreatobacter stygius]QCI67901.1 sulfurtransferase TusA family protein [Phreatobacter stygius]
MTETALDLRGLKCPLPALKTRKALTRIAQGDKLVVTCTDPMAAIDIPNLIRETGDSLEAQEKHEATLVFHIRKQA